MQHSTDTEVCIALVRHARSSHVHAGWIDARGFRAWREAYEAAAIRDDERVPAPLQQLASRGGIVLSSDAPRALASARMMAGGREVVVSTLLRELDLEGPALGGLRLPLGAWAVAVGGRTLVRTLQGQYPSAAEAARIEGAATWIEELAAQHSPVIAVTHAMFRRRLAARLAKAGWQPVPGRRSLQPWSAWLFTAARTGSLPSPGARV
jgi:broad specificity phosphatase PhoE